MRSRPTTVKVVSGTRRTYGLWEPNDLVVCGGRRVKESV
jgi:hypothetical protein